MLDESYLKILKEDPRIYLSTFCKLKTKEKTIIPFKLNKPQADLFDKLDEYNRVIILKARQLGMSSGVCGYLYHKTITQPATNTVIIGYKRDEAAVLLNTIKMFWETTPALYRPEIKYNTKYEMSFPKLNSMITVLPSTATAGRGRMINYLLATELAFWDHADETFTGLSECVPKDGMIIVESTPNGVGSLYHQMYSGHDNGYEKLLYTYDWLYTDEEMEVKKRALGLRRWSQEYGTTFLTSGNNVFSAELLDKHMVNVLKDGGETMIDKFRMYKKPEAGHKYVISVDPSGGLAGGDFSAVLIFDRMTGEEVGYFRDRIPPDRLAAKVNIWGRMFFNAFCVVEENNHGLTVLTELRRLAYPCLYFRRILGEREDRVTEIMGWKTTTRSKPLMIDDLAKILQEGTEAIKIKSPEIIDELRLFEKKDNGSMGAPDGFHDDLVMSLALNIQGFKMIPTRKLLQIDESEHVIL